MDVILLERVEKLGQMGDVVNVKPGYARNYLLPQKKALRATEANKAVFDGQKAQLEADNLQRRQEAEAVAEKMVDVSVIILRQAGEAGQLYGSANSRDVATALTEDGYTVSRSQIELAHPIKSVGMHEVIVRLHPEVAVTVTVNVARTAEEAQIQVETGAAVLGGEEEEENTDLPPMGYSEDEPMDAEAAEGEAGDEAPAEEEAASVVDETTEQETA
ncbi:50S ribosomal protein L9 [Magnetospira sp. QH-2]|uniref:50S ribosomal protein L9 n=1 Tax=Magnetospira sp. (strain QH-2) TaxID=1288970 RepID=UPI0003E80D24|nr:50S ribosomal protein L9 [Magnetospira sp. QH-2]CCQ74431.1 50S ribosomal protein L9 [Magnetospira sp. QH-2]